MHERTNQMTESAPFLKPLKLIAPEQARTLAINQVSHHAKGEGRGQQQRGQAKGCRDGMREARQLNTQDRGQPCPPPLSRAAGGDIQDCWAGDV
jgi:hypothetical protein